MDIKSKILLSLVLVLLFSFMCIGYAQVTTTLGIEGQVQSAPPATVHIISATGESGKDITISGFAQTVLNSTVNLGAGGSNTASINLTVLNNTPYTYTFDEVIVGTLAESYTNSNIEFYLTGIEHGTEVLSGDTIDFTITFKYKNTSQITDTSLTSSLNFYFVPAAEFIPDVAVDNALGKFKEILNTKIDFDDLTEKMESNGGVNNTYIGNVVGAKSGTEPDSDFLNDLFTEDGVNYLTLQIGDTKTEVTILIKREDVDGNKTNGDGNGNEMTIYLTPDDPSKATSRNPDVTVYAAVFTRDTTDGEWYQIGEMYEGQAETNNYENGVYIPFISPRNSFNTDTWESTLDYYGTGKGANIETIIANIPKE